jgi:hypothetical protein
LAVSLNFSRLLGLLFFARCVALGSESEIRLEYFTNSPALFEGDEQPSSFWQRFESEFQERSAEVFADRLHPFKLVTWGLQERSGRGARIAEAASDAARGSIMKSATYSLREAVLGFPTLEWVKDNPGLVYELLRNSVDEVHEESVSPLDPAFGLAERSWWNRLRSGGHFKYGLRPFRTSPYAFLSFRVNDGKLLYLLGHVRYHFHNWTQQSVELALSLPLPHGFAIDAGTSYELWQKEQAHRVVVKLFKHFSSDGIVHVGFEVKERPMVLAGLAFSW